MPDEGNARYFIYWCNQEIPGSFISELEEQETKDHHQRQDTESHKSSNGSNPGAGNLCEERREFDS